MKKILFILSIISYSLVYSQSTFQDGFNTGYQSGYCYGEYGCISPPPPIGISSITPVGQTDYQHGYNSGFAEGQKNKISNQDNNNGGAYGQLKYTEPDRTQEYIQNGIKRLMEEQANRKKPDNEMTED